MKMSVMKYMYTWYSEPKLRVKRDNKARGNSVWQLPHCAYQLRRSWLLRWWFTTLELFCSHSWARFLMWSNTLGTRLVVSKLYIFPCMLLSLSVSALRISCLPYSWYFVWYCSLSLSLSPFNKIWEILTALHVYAICRV